YVPLDPVHPAGRLAEMVADSGLAVVVTERALRGRVVDAREVLIDTVTPLALEAEQKLGEAQAAYVIYTSGSTGRPKGVMVPHGAVTRLIAATRERYELTSTDVW